MAAPASRRARRLFRIARIFARYDILGALIELGAAPGALRLLNPFFRSRKTRHLRIGQRLALAAQELGPSFIKAGQTLSTRADLVGEQVAIDLAGLQDRLPPFPSEAARATIEAELGRPLSELFAEFDDVPVAAASIAQVHFAVTTDGRPVAVKVLRPQIEKQFADDLDLFDLGARLIERWQPKFRRLKPRAVVETLRESVQIEMDLRFEAAAASELAENFEGDPGFRIPKVDWERTGRRVLTLERVSGIRVGDVEAFEAAGVDPRIALGNASRAFFNQVFRDGFFHADMHAGNAFVDPKDGAIIAIDFGIMGRLDKRNRYFLADMLLGFLNGDYERVAQVHFDAGFIPANQSLPLFTQAVRSIGEPLMGRPLSEISLGRLLAQLFQITETFQMETQPQLLMLQKTMLMAEGMGRQLDPSVNMWELAQPLIEDWMMTHRGPAARVGQAVEDGIALVERLPRLVAAMDRLTQRLEKEGAAIDPSSLERAEEQRHSRAVVPWPIWVLVGLALGAALFG
ncbi:2-polyprenylphenol 6-hydroxylase [Lacibacterium aquatile]|uniref:2-polyprenylphenol 6-hydroxylase n=1 Tax=Lacibacterium aquatile TaxID=1168082 RepID=A0ABW5DKM3_9PROT